MKTEFFDFAAKSGFYGIERNNIYGKKDNARKYWEDIFIKLHLREDLKRILGSKSSIRVFDSGCGSGEAYELLSHIPSGDADHDGHGEFIPVKKRLELYHGVDVSESMLEQGRRNYKGKKKLTFSYADLSEGFPASDENPFDIYLSSYSSLSHLSYDEFVRYSRQMTEHAPSGSVIFYDMLGRFSPEWPLYWKESAGKMLPYNMAYLVKEEERTEENIDAYDMTYWSGHELEKILINAADSCGKKVQIEMKDRSIFIGRHMDTGIFNGNKRSYRKYVNLIFDRDYRGKIKDMDLDIAFLDKYKEDAPEAYGRISSYAADWNAVTRFATALFENDSERIKSMIESAPAYLGEDFKMLAWLSRNSSRFPVVDFWSSIIGPQIGCILRNLEYDLPQGLGCGHGLQCLVRIL